MNKFRFYQGVYLTRGYGNFIISDLDSNSYYSFSNELLDDKGDLTIELQNILIAEGLGLFEENVVKTKMRISRNIYSNRIDNAIIEIDDYGISHVSNILSQLKREQINKIELRFNSENSDHLFFCIKEFSLANLSYFIVFLPYNNNLKILKIKNVLRLVDLLVIHSIKNNIDIDFEHSNHILLKDNINNLHCGKFGVSRLLANKPLFTESQHHNSCLNRKISIDAEGNIKNCPSMEETFGNIRDTTLAEAVEKQGFKKYWNINKDKIHVCKDCEFRYICTDCRAYVEDPEDIFSKPLKCGYNPYTGEWSEWSTNPLKQKAIDLYGMREMVENKTN